MAEEEAAVLYALLELFIVVALVDVGIAILASFLEDVVLYVVKHLLHSLCDAIKRKRFFFQSVAAHNLDGAVLQVAAADGKTHGHTLEFIVGKLEARTLVVGIVILDADSCLAQLVYDGLHLGRDGCKLFVVL